MTFTYCLFDEISCNYTSKKVNLVGVNLKPRSLIWRRQKPKKFLKKNNAQFQRSTTWSLHFQHYSYSPYLISLLTLNNYTKITKSLTPKLVIFRFFQLFNSLSLHYGSLNLIATQYFCTLIAQAPKASWPVTNLTTKLTYRFNKQSFNFFKRKLL